MNKKSLASTALASVLAGGLSIAATNAAFAADDEKMEKCYGVVKASMNDCGTPVHACAGQAKTDGDPQEWVFVPQGLCEKLVNGSLMPPDQGP